MRVRDAAVAALRVAVAAFGGSLAGLPTARTLLDVQAQVNLLPVAGWIGFVTFLVAFSALWGAPTVMTQARRIKG